MEGIIKKWNEKQSWGVIYAPEGARYFTHRSKIISGQPELFRRVTFDILPGRTPQEMQQAVNIIVGESLEGGSR